MKKNRWILKLLAVVAGLVLVIWVIGYILPEGHKVSVSRELNLPPEKTWHLLTDFEDFPSWRSDIKAVKALSSTSWIEVDKWGEQIAYEQVQKINEQRLVTQITTMDLPYSGKWIFDIEARGDRTYLTIEEQGIVHNPIFRFVSTFIIGHSSGIENYFDDLEKVVP